MSDASKKTNAARRVYEILNEATQQRFLEPNDKWIAATVWASVFGFPDVGNGHTVMSPALEDQIIPMLSELRRQIRRVEEIFKQESDYAVLAPQFRAWIDETINGTSSNQLNGTWVNIRREHLKATTVAGWGFLAKALPDDEPTISPEESDALTLAIRELEEAAQGPGVPSDLRDFILSQVAELRSALFAYGVSGIEPLRKAVAAGIGELRRESDVSEQLKSDPGHGVLAKLTKVWELGAKLCDDLEKYTKGADTVAKVYGAIAHHPVTKSLILFIGGGS